jgi:UDP-glucose 4-epimerase
LNILVTGGAGFIGSHLTEELLHDGHVVTVLDNLTTGKRQNLPVDSSVSFVEGDVADLDVVHTAMKGCDAIFHLAAVASVKASVDTPSTTHRTNFDGTLAVLETARTLGVRRVIYASSAAVYGDAASLPVMETSTTKPMSPYAADKLAGEHYLAHFHRQGDLNGIAFRFFNIYGPRQDPASPYSGVISIFAERASRGAAVTIHGDGQQTRDFVYVKDLVSILVRSLSCPHEDELPVINVGRGEAISLLDLIREFEAITGNSLERSFIPSRQGDIRHSLASVRQLHDRFPGMRFTPIRAGLRSLLGDARTCP